MIRLPKIFLVATLAALTLALPRSALGFDAGVRAPVLADPAPGAVSLPFEIPVRQSAAVPQPLDFEISVEGFTLDPDPQSGRRIGSFDMVSDSGEFNDKAIYSNGPGAYGVRSWTIDWQMGEEPITATVEDGISLTASGQSVADPDSTLISFTVPGNYHGFRLMGISLRFNQQERGRATEGVGAVNPAEPGSYLIRTRVKSVAPESRVKVASAQVRVETPSPRTSLSVKANRTGVRQGGQVRFRLRTTNGTRDKVAIWLSGRKLGTVKVGPEGRNFVWRCGPRVRARNLHFSFRPLKGPAKTVSLKVKG